MRIFVLCAAVAATATACAAAPTNGGPPPPSVAITGKTWVAETVLGEPAPADVSLTLLLTQDGRAAGRAGCNQYGGAVAVHGGRIMFKPLVSTRMACSQPVMDQEEAFLEALQASERFQIDAEGRLLIFTRDPATPPSAFTAAPPAR